jgi:hypothetical protein
MFSLLTLLTSGSPNALEPPADDGVADGAGPDRQHNDDPEDHQPDQDLHANGPHRRLPETRIASELPPMVAYIECRCIATTGVSI